MFGADIANQLEELVDRVNSDLRVMADRDFFIGQPAVLLGIMPGGGGSQRLTRLVGAHTSLVAILEGKPFTPAEALANGAGDAVVPRDEVVAKSIELAEDFGVRSMGSVALESGSVPGSTNGAVSRRCPLRSRSPVPTSRSPTATPRAC